MVKRVLNVYGIQEHVTDPRALLKWSGDISFKVLRNLNSLTWPLLDMIGSSEAFGYHVRAINTVDDRRNAGFPFEMGKRVSWIGVNGASSQQPCNLHRDGVPQGDEGEGAP